MIIERRNSENDEKRYIYKIMGEEYVLRGTDDPQYMEEVVAYLESTLEQITQSNPKLNKGQVAILAALKIADEFHKLRQEYQYLDELMKDAR